MDPAPGRREEPMAWRLSSGSSDVPIPMYHSPCNCNECHQQYREYEKQRTGGKQYAYQATLTDAQAKKRSNGLSQEIQQSRIYLEKMCKNYGDEILSSWQSLSRDARQKILLEAEPTMYEHKHGEPHHVATFAGDIGISTWAFRNFNLAPYINLEALKEDPSCFLGLLYNRIRFSPEEWAPYDNYKLRMPWDYGGFRLAWNPNCVVMYGERFGDLVDWNEDEAHRWDIIGFPRAHLILEAQSYIMRVLRSTVDILAKRFNNASHGYSQWESFGATGITSKRTCGFAAGYPNQPFSKPPVFEIENLLSIAESRRNEMGDHLWLLQTDPAYCRRIVSLIIQGSLTSLLNTTDTNYHVAEELIRDAHTYWIWTWILEDGQGLKTVHDCDQHIIVRGKKLPDEYSRRLVALENLLQTVMVMQARELRGRVAQRPGFAHHWKKHKDKDTVWFKRKVSDIGERSFYTDPLHWVLYRLLVEPYEWRRYEHSMLFAFLNEHLANTTQENRERLDELLYNKYSNLAAYHEMFLSLRLCRPRPTNRDEITAQIGLCSDRKTARYMGKKFLEYSIERSRKSDALSIELANAIAEFRRTPLPTGKKVQQWLDGDCAVRGALSNFWAVVRSQHKSSVQELNKIYCSAPSMSLAVKQELATDIKKLAQKTFTLKELKAKGAILISIKPITDEEIKSDLKDLSADLTDRHVAALTKERDSILSHLAFKEARKKSKPKTAPQTQQPNADIKPVSDQPHLQKGRVSSVEEKEARDGSLATKKPASEANRSSKKISRFQASAEDADDEREPENVSFPSEKSNSDIDHLSKRISKRQLSNHESEPQEATGPKDQQPAPPTTTTQSPLPVKQDTFKVLTKMFPAAGNSYGAISWSSFVLAMSCTGMSPSLLLEQRRK